MTNRREFFKQSGTALGVAALSGGALSGIPRLLSAAPAPTDRALATFADPAATRELMMVALDAARISAPGCGIDSRWKPGPREQLLRPIR